MHATVCLHCCHGNKNQIKSYNFYEQTRNIKSEPIWRERYNYDLCWVLLSERFISVLFIVVAVKHIQWNLNEKNKSQSGRQLKFASKRIQLNLILLSLKNKKRGEDKRNREEKFTKIYNKNCSWKTRFKVEYYLVTVLQQEYCMQFLFSPQEDPLSSLSICNAVGKSFSQTVCIASYRIGSEI